jgi:MATE family multidrug resistance protein
VLAEYAGLGLGLVIVRVNWRARGGWPGWSAILVLGRFRRLLAVNRDLFLRSLMLEAAFLAFTAIGSRQGELVLAANAVLMNFFTAAAYGLDGFAHAAEAMVGRAVGARDRRGFHAAVRAGFSNAALLAVSMTLAFAVLGGWGVRLMTGLEEVRAQAMTFLPYIVVLPLVSVWAFLFDGVFFGATRTAELRNGMAAALALFVVTAAALVPIFGNHGLWLTFLIFLAGRAAILGLIYRRAERVAAFVPA